MRILLSLTILLSATWFCAASDLPRSTPESQGVSSAGILEFVEAANKEIDSLHSLMIVRHGHVVAEGWWAPYNAKSPHLLYSLTKSFASTAVGMAAAEGKLNLDDLVLKFFPEEAPAIPSDNLKKMRVSDLLRMSTGHQTEPPRGLTESWVKSFMVHPVPFKPGTHFLYNNSASYMLSAIVQKTTGMTVLDYLMPRLFEPLGIERPTWEASPQGISNGGCGLSLCTEQIAKFGQLYLQKGMWQGKRLLSEAWIEAATSRQAATGSDSSRDSDQGYGYQFWRNRNNSYRADGAFGQLCLVLPEHDVVIVFTSGVSQTQPIFDKVWDKLLPAMKSEPLAADDEARTKLETVLKGLSLRPQEGSASPIPSMGKKYVFPVSSEQKLESVAWDTNPEDGTTTLAMRVNGSDQRVVCGRGVWKTGRASWGLIGPRPVAASGAWSEDGVFNAKLCFYETPFTITLSLKPAGNQAQLLVKPNLGRPRDKDKDKDEWLTGKAVEVSADATSPVGTEVALGQTPPVDPKLPPVSTCGGPVRHDFDKWEKEISAFEETDKTTPPPKNGVLFIGSSTIRLWKTLEKDFPNHKVINRGFGGSEIMDSTHFADRIIFPYEPKQIFLRAGGNDIHNGRLPEEVATDFGDFVRKIHHRLPKTEIFFVGISPTPSRWGETEKYRLANELIHKMTLKLPNVSFINTFDFTVDATGKAPRRDLFVDDMQHFNPNGYKLLADEIRPFLHHVPPAK